MDDDKQILNAEGANDPQAPARLLPLVYDELRRLAAVHMATERPGHTLDATALVHEVFLKLGSERLFATRADYFRAAAQAMRRILVDHARKHRARKRGGGQQAQTADDKIAAPEPDPDLEALDEALTHLATVQPQVAELVQLRYFAGLTIPEAAALLGISPRTADGWWAYARGWLAAEVRPS